MFSLKKRYEVYVAKCSSPFKDKLVMVGIKLLWWPVGGLLL